MTIEYLNTPGVPEPQGFTHVSVARGERLIHIAGQVGQDENGDIVPGGLAAQPSDQPRSTTRLASCRRLFRLRAALA
jgi:enamine deaminase RidA (YjgF/YER057c/UK114 family)